MAQHQHMRGLSLPERQDGWTRGQPVGARQASYDDEHLDRATSPDPQATFARAPLKEPGHAAAFVPLNAFPHHPAVPDIPVSGKYACVL